MQWRSASGGFVNRFDWRAGARFGAGEKTSVIARDLRVSERSVERWRRAWRRAGGPALDWPRAYAEAVGVPVRRAGT
ncbi:helix-turn-helix domain-containing protein [Kitasatospora sp. NPDC018058]|uniref:helix-turn-helix domain-containing protein n=1 Tax=Kitasatospora sp. NPDC018058 TaxID=3364025 RepID=UPI0037C02F73